MQRWTFSPDTTDPSAVPEFAQAVAALKAGRLVGVPTETVYGLAADASNPTACAAIFAAKGRPHFNPLIAHVESLEAAQRHALFNARALALAEAFWPGALTLVLPKRADSPVCDLATAGLDSIALRVPAAPVMRALARAVGAPLAAPSANRSGRISGTTANAVAGDLGPALAMLIDAGPTPVGVESTIVGLTGPEAVLLRPGGIARERIEQLLGARLAAPAASATTTEAPQAPGMLSSHYAPGARVRLNATEVLPGEALMRFGPDLPQDAEQAVAVENLSPDGDLTQAAARLFQALRRLDSSGAHSIAVMPVPENGLGEAINDRLRRAAAPRPAT
ncbi:L-threonylcarbamoyladenylate synthase [Stappia sp. ES.058]|uniref:L-threonylcarbamoyladenylate synthase n=1 Tax=Stappia sp. ES.058 TaxID=1881061 RepID=UPI00087AD6D9|nr:L-threonylcarbamoyladenylate synthase [Stappia sp. ES.058]SDT93162.1 translation factor SUA5 [Stappia sp. ES.058]